MTLGKAIARGILPAPKYVVSLYSFNKDLKNYRDRIRRSSAAICAGAEEISGEAAPGAGKRQSIGFQWRAVPRPGMTYTMNAAPPGQLLAKRILEIVGGLVGSLLALIAIAIVGPKIKKVSPGPILFKQVRIGQNGKRFSMLKIRTMYLDAEERKAELMKDNRVSDGMMFKLDWDPRIIGNKIVDGKQVTGIGEKLRSGSWDEWPQFLNILKGDMSLVGTRPPTVDEWEKYKYHHRARLATKPGLTGMWQVSGRSKITDFEEVVKLDTEYIKPCYMRM